MNAQTLLQQLRSLADEAAAALENGGVETLILNSFNEAATPIWIQIGIAARTANTPPQPTGRFSGVRTPGAPAAPAPARTMPPVQAAPKNAPAAKPAPAPAQKTGHLLKITPPPLKRRRMAGMC